MDARHTAEHAAHFERHGWVLIERLLIEPEVEAALPGLFQLYPTPEQFHGGEDPRAARYREGADGPAGVSVRGCGPEPVAGAPGHHRGRRDTASYA